MVRAAAHPAVIFLSFALALGFLLVILSCALWKNWMPFWSALAFAMAPAPNALFGGLAGADSFSDLNKYAGMLTQRVPRYGLLPYRRAPHDRRRPAAHARAHRHHHGDGRGAVAQRRPHCLRYKYASILTQ